MGKQSSAGIGTQRGISARGQLWLAVLSVILVAAIGLTLNGVAAQRPAAPAAANHTDEVAAIQPQAASHDRRPEQNSAAGSDAATARAEDDTVSQSWTTDFAGRIDAVAAEQRATTSAADTGWVYIYEPTKQEWLAVQYSLEVTGAVIQEYVELRNPPDNAAPAQRQEGLKDWSLEYRGFVGIGD